MEEGQAVLKLLKLGPFENFLADSGNFSHGLDFSNFKAQKTSTVCTFRNYVTPL